ncbi:MAG: hypothetical protein AAF267_05800 [Deinococcota bacterium]
MSRPAKTFLIEAGSHHYRVDLRNAAGRFEVAAVYRGEESAEDDLNGPVGIHAFDPMGPTAGADWIAPLLKLRPKPAPEITILSDRVSTVIAEIPTDTGEDLRTSAELEAQTISGLSSSEAVAATSRLPGEPGIAVCWVVQVAMRQVAAMRTAVATASKSRLVEVGHPAGVRLDPIAPQLEVWNEFALFHAPGGERIDLHGWNGPDALAEAEVDGRVMTALLETSDGLRFLAGVADAELTIPETQVTESPVKEVPIPGAPVAPLRQGDEGQAGPPPVPVVPPQITRIDFSEIEAVTIWSGALANSCDPLSGKLLGQPVVKVPKPPTSGAAIATRAALIAVPVAVLLGGHYFVTERIQANLESDLERLKAPAERVAESRSKISALKQELQKIKSEEADQGGSDVNVYAHRRRIGALLDGIATGSKVTEAVVVDFRPDELDTIVTGAATTFNAPQALASQIDAALASDGWRAALVRRTARMLRPDGGPWSYEIRLTPGRPVSIEEEIGQDEASEPQDGVEKTADAESAGISVAPRGTTTASVNF